MDEGNDLTWLAEERNKLFNGLLDLHRSQKQIEADDWLYLVGVGFSLWRAVFLVRSKRPRAMAGIMKDAQSFLERVIEMNTIQFQNDYQFNCGHAGTT
jgi:hypothetical protein